MLPTQLGGFVVEKRSSLGLPFWGSGTVWSSRGAVAPCTTRPLGRSPPHPATRTARARPGGFVVGGRPPLGLWFWGSGTVWSFQKGGRPTHYLPVGAVAPHVPSNGPGRSPTPRPAPPVWSEDSVLGGHPHPGLPPRGDGVVWGFRVGGRPGGTPRVDWGGRPKPLVVNPGHRPTHHDGVLRGAVGGAPGRGRWLGVVACFNTPSPRRGESLPA